MIYLDYSATTPVDKLVLEDYIDFSRSNFANSNSLHKLGKEALIDLTNTTKNIKEKLNLLTHELIYTSGATEANNLALKGVAYKNRSKGNHIITSPFEHSSITTTLNYLAKQGFIIDVLDFDDYGRIDLEELDSLITDETILVSIGIVNSEVGLSQDLNAIRSVLNNYPNVLLHSDMTQAIGKIELDFSLADLISFSAHKLYGFKGIGGLFVRKGIKLTPIIHGGKSVSQYRGGTPPTNLIHSLGKTIEVALTDFEKKLNKIKELNLYLVSQLQRIDNIVVNSSQYSIDQIVNFSYLPLASNKLQKYLSDKNIYVSTTTACSSDKSISKVVKEITGSYEQATTSIRVSLSHLTTKDEIDLLTFALRGLNSENS
ncbi:MAG: cysteine desulfurase [Candidatus Izimaplasma sp.]|nr:cysteine desulfurase [Candidatus Izimaplasma bacterium]